MQIAQKNFYKKFLGRQGELKAQEFLKESGYKILDSNFKTHIGEIDIICEREGTIVFVEVKTRSNDNYGRPSEAVNIEKQKKYILVSQEYMLKNKLMGKNCRFDIIEIQDGEINHIENAFC